MKHFYGPKLRSGFFLLICLSLISFAGKAQVSSYTFSQLSGTYTPITGGTTLGTATNDDTSFPSLPIGFTFNYNNTSYTSFSAQSNGFIALGTAVNSSYTSISSGSTNNIIAALNFDLQGNSTGGNLRYETIGTAPNRVLVVQWSDYMAWPSNNGEHYNFQIRLYETTDVVEVVYGAFTATSTRSPQVGLRGNSNADFNNRTSTVSWATTTAGTANSNTVTLSATSFPTSGLTFRWTPPAPTPMAYVSSTVTQTNTSGLTLGSTNNEIVGVRIVTAGTQTPFNLTSLTINSNGSTNFPSDVTSVRVWYTGTSPTFATTTLFGSALNLSSPITGNQVLATGTNYFWVTYDIANNATIGNVVDAEVTSITMTGAGGTQTPTVSAPAGNRMINYCIPTYGSACSSADFINNVSTTGGITNITNNNTGCNSQPNNYIYYSSMTVSQMTTLSFNLTMQSGSSWSQGFGVWVDWNHDGDFYDTGENVYLSPTSATTPFTTTITIPSNAAAGITRMRIRCAFATVPTDPCNNQSFGETEDYNIDVIPLPAIDAGVNMLVSPSHSGCHNTVDSVTVRIKNYGSGPIDYSTNPVTVNVSATGVNPVTFSPVTLTSGILPIGGTQNVTVSTSYNMSVAGNYIFNASTSTVGDGYAPNDAMVADTVVSRNPMVNASPNTIICENTSTPLSVATTTYGNGPIDTLANATAVPIPDNAPPGAASVINVPVGPTSASSVIAVVIDSLAHTFDNQLSIYLYAPNGSFVDLSSTNGGAGDNYVRTTFISSAPASITTGTAPFTGNFKPEQQFSTLTGVGSGNWTLKIIDPILGDVGTLYGWKLILPLGNQVMSYAWSPSAGLSSTTISNPSASPITTTTYNVMVMDMNGCTNSDSVTITVNPAPVVTLGADRGFCNGDSLLLDAGPGMIGYTWSTGATTQSIMVNGTGLYAVTVMDANVCTKSDTVLITEFMPVVNLGSDTAVCQGNTVTLNAGSGFTTYNWSNSATTQQTTVTSSNTYYVSVTDTNNCPASDTIMVTVNALPSVNLGNNINACQGDTITLDAGAGYASYSWSTTASTQQINVMSSNTYSVSVVDMNGCTNSDSINVVINAVPVVNLGPNMTQCGGTVTLNAGSGNTYLWSTGASTQTITTSASGTISVDVTNASGCTASDTITVTINPVPVAFAGNDTLICSQSSITLNGGAGYSSYLWQYGAFTATSQMITVSPGTTTVYSLSVTDNNGCTSSPDMVTVSVEPLPNANFTFTSTGTSVTFTNSSVGNTNVGYLWIFGDNSANSTAVSPTHTYPSNGFYTVTLVITTACGMDTTTQLVPITVGVEEIAGFGSLLVYPNPSEGSFNIAIKDADMNELSIEVMDLQGKVVYSASDKNISSDYVKQLDLSAVAKGVYYLRLNSGKQVTTQKLIIQ